MDSTGARSALGVEFLTEEHAGREVSIQSPYPQYGEGASLHTPAIHSMREAGKDRHRKDDC